MKFFQRGGIRLSSYVAFKRVKNVRSFALPQVFLKEVETSKRKFRPDEEEKLPVVSRLAEEEERQRSNLLSE